MVLLMLLLILMVINGCDYYHIDREIDYGWFTVIQKDSDIPTIINNRNEWLTVQIYVPDADFRKWFMVKELRLAPLGSGDGVNYLEGKYIYYKFWVLESHKVDIRGDKGVVINAKVL